MAGDASLDLSILTVYSLNILNNSGLQLFMGRAKRQRAVSEIYSTFQTILNNRPKYL
jgi:hypothetical protein